MRCRALTKRYPDVVAVDGLDLVVRAGECFGLLGPNGAGKTTAIEILEGLIEPDAGDVEVLGLTWQRDARAIRERIGVQLQETQLPQKLTVGEVVRLFRSFYRSGPASDDVLGFVQLQEKRDAWVSKLSGGQRQRLAVACALVGAPDLLFLDEPTTGLDPQSRRALWELIEAFRARGNTVLLTTHYMEEAARRCDRVGIVDRSKIIAVGTPGLLIGSRARTVEGVQGLLNLASVPMWVLLSGVFFASSNFPDIMRPFIQAPPLTALNNALRAVMLEGATIFQVSGFIGILLAWGAACFTAAIALFRWR